MLFWQLQIIPLVLCFATINSFAQTHKLPNKIRQDLTRQIGNWQLVSFTQPDGKKCCQVITGDFDGNRQSDYAVYVMAEKGSQATRQRLILYLKKGPHYYRRTLSRQTANTEIMPFFFKKGTKDYRYDTHKYFHYKYDTVGLFSEKAGESYLYRKGRFYPVITSD